MKWEILDFDRIGVQITTNYMFPEKELSPAIDELLKKVLTENHVIKYAL
jgi:hypothetical protein